MIQQSIINYNNKQCIKCKAKCNTLYIINLINQIDKDQDINCFKCNII